MANQFIKDVGTEVVKFDTPSFVNSGASTSDIVRGAVASTSGNNFLDIAINKAIDYSKKLDVMKANNEKAKHSIELQKNLQDYENMWQESGNNKYSDENYSNYITGLNEIYDTAKMNFATTKYTRESDVLNWENSLDEDRNKSIFMQNGEKARFDIQAVTDETLMNVSAMANNYIMNGNYQELSDAVMLLDGLSDFIPKHQLDEMKRKQVMVAEQNKMKNDIERIVNDPSLSIQQKRDRLTTVQNNITKNKETYEYMGKQAVEMGLYSDIEVAKSDYQAMYQDALNQNGGIIGRLESQIRDEEYRNMVARENLEMQRKALSLQEMQSVHSAIQFGDNYRAIGLLEGRYVDPNELISNENGIGEKYYGVTPHDILYTTNEKGEKVASDKYIPVNSVSTINGLKNKIKVADADNIPRHEQIKSVIESINSESNLDVAENLKREMVAYGVLSKMEASMLVDGVTPVGASKQEYVNYANIGRKNMSNVSVKDLVGAKGNIGQALAPIAKDYNRQVDFMTIVNGAVLEGRFGTLFGGRNVNVHTINEQMNDKEFRQFVYDTVDMIQKTNYNAYSTATLNADESDIVEMVNRKNRNKSDIRWSTKESGLNVQRQKL